MEHYQEAILKLLRDYIPQDKKEGFMVQLGVLVSSAEDSGVNRTDLFNSIYAKLHAE